MFKHQLLYRSNVYRTYIIKAYLHRKMKICITYFSGDRSHLEECSYKNDTSHICLIIALCYIVDICLYCIYFECNNFVVIALVIFHTSVLGL